MTTQSDVYIKNISVELCNNLPGFGAYMMHESDPDAPAVVLLNLRVAVEAAKAMRDGTEQVKLCISETLTHELLHVVQDIVGASVTEEEVHNALAQATGDVEVYDSDDEAREALYNENTQLRAELEQERAKVEALWECYCMANEVIVNFFYSKAAGLMKVKRLEPLEARARELGAL